MARSDLVVANGHIDDTVRNIRGNVGYAQPPQIFLNNGQGKFQDVAAAAGEAFSQPKVGRGLCYADFDRDGDLDILMTTNNGPAYLYRNDQQAGNHSIRFRLTGTKSNRDAIGAMVRIEHEGVQPIAPGKRRLKLLVAVRAARNLRPRQTRQNRSRRDRMAQRQNRRIQKSRRRPDLRLRRRQRHHPARATSSSPATVTQDDTAAFSPQQAAKILRVVVILSERRQERLGPNHFDFSCGEFAADAGPAAGPRLFKYAMICQRDGSGIALQVGMPRRRLPFFSSQKMSPSVACTWTRSLRRLGCLPRPSASAPWHLAQ